MKLRNVLSIAAVTAFTSITPAVAGCLPSTEKSLSYCSGYLGMMFEFMSTPHDFFDDGYLELEAIRVDKQCNYYNQTDGITELQWAEFMHNSGKIEFSLLMQSQDVPKLTVLRDECASIIQAYDSSKQFGKFMCMNNSINIAYNDTSACTFFAGKQQI